MKNCSRSAKITMVALLLVAATVASAMALPQIVTRLSYAAEAGQALAARDQLGEAQQLSTSFQAVAKAMRPSVVSISSVQTLQPARGRNIPRGGLPEEFRGLVPDDFFDRFGGQFEFEMPQQPRSREGLGSGVIVGEDGYILTNNHVVRDADEVTVMLSDNREFHATVVGTDEKTDLAVLKINATGLVAAKLGNSDELEVGQWVVAVGTPFGLQQTVTTGIVSAKGRANVGIVDYEDFIQTDAAINPGNSGGPLVNLRGEVIGVNTAIASRTGVYNGIGFAIPSNMAQSVMQAIMSNGSVTRGWLGAAIQDLSQDLASYYKYDSTDGVLVGDVIADSPASKAGLQPEDIVSEFRGQKMRSANHLRNTVAATAPGTVAELKIVRDGQPMTLSVNIGELDGQISTRIPVSGNSSPREEEAAGVGMSVTEITPEIAQSLGYRGEVAGVVVSSTAPGGLADRAGISSGDLIVQVGETKIANMADFRTAVDQANLDSGVVMHVRRGGTQRIVFLRNIR